MSNKIIARMEFKAYGYGWSEAHVWEPVTGDKTLNLCIQECLGANKLLALRSKLLGQGAELTKIRVSWSGIWRDSETRSALGSPAFKERTRLSDLNKDRPSDSAFKAFKVKLNLTDNYRAVTYLSGCPTAEMQEGNLLNADPQYLLALQEYMTYLTNRGTNAKQWGAFISTKETNAARTYEIDVPNNNPTIATVGGVPELTVTFKTAIPLVVKGSRVRILGVKGRSGTDGRKWNGVFEVRDMLAPKVLVLRSKVAAATLPPLDFSEGYGWLIGQDFKLYDDWDISGVTHRKRGKPSDSPRGRS